MPAFKPKQTVLLTGAGFTHTFEAPLARDMWNWIFYRDEIQSRHTLLHELQQNTNFEDVYQDVMAGAFSVDDKSAMRSAVLAAYQDLDVNLSQCEAWKILSHVALDQLIDSFKADRNQKEKGFFFTLNQDLYIERQYFNGERPSLPGIPPQRIWINGDIARRQPLDESGYITLPTNDQLEQFKIEFLQRYTTFCYVKLHGSLNWLSSDGTRQLVIGGQKEAQLRREPVLSWYLDLFDEVLHEPERWLLIVGYGFADEHINRVMADAVVSSKLRFVVVMPKPNNEVITMIERAPHGASLIRGFAGHVHYSLAEILPADPQTGLININSPGWSLLKKNFFQKVGLFIR